jgi:predicted O-linked N-acetylglucosamine transferase (SPINDLY family)
MLDLMQTPATFADLVTEVEKIGADTGRQAVIARYREWIAAHQGDALLHAAWFNLAVELNQAGDAPGARAAYETSLSLHPGFAPAATNLGLLLERGGDGAAALATWARATQADESRTTLLNHQARLSETTGRLAEAEALLRRSLATNRDQPDAIQHFVHLRQKMCEWPVLDGSTFGLSPADMLASCGPLGVMALTDDIAAQTAIATGWIGRKTRAVPERLAPPLGYRHDRLRIGYLSSDFCRHAMSYLVAELFERHDRARFEVFGYCSTIDDGSAVRRRVLAGFDHCRIVLGLTDEQAARAIREDEIDILVDLNGLTQGSRLQILRWRPAPVQATYLGFVGPVPVPELDYLFCDDIVVPPQAAAAYLPRPLAIGPCYQANDSRREGLRDLTREEAGLPPEGFVFCCFSNHYKVTTEVFAAWMRILQRAEGSWLWLAVDNVWSQQNLSRAAAAAGVAPERLIFASRCDPDRYLGRLAAADLFLDTFPYNAGTIASDAIRMGLPIVTLCGQAFASRMATSLLSALGSTEGVTSSLAAYEAKAVEFATDPVAYRAYKRCFTRQRWYETIGDMSAMIRHYEKALKQIAMHARRPEAQATNE